MPETAKRLCDIAEVVALKEATGSILRCLDVFEQCGERLTLLSGDDFVVAPFIASGGKGVISVSSNVAPRLMADLVAAALAGDTAKALALQLELQPLHRLLFCESNPIPVKMALHLMGRFTRDIRPPLVPMTDGNAAKLEGRAGEAGAAREALSCAVNPSGTGATQVARARASRSRAMQVAWGQRRAQSSSRRTAYGAPGGNPFRRQPPSVVRHRGRAGS